MVYVVSLLPSHESKGGWVILQAGCVRMGSKSVPPCNLNQESRLTGQQPSETNFFNNNMGDNSTQQGHSKPWPTRVTNIHWSMTEGCCIAGAGVYVLCYTWKDHNVKDRV